MKVFSVMECGRSNEGMSLVASGVSYDRNDVTPSGNKCFLFILFCNVQSEIKGNGRDICRCCMH